MLKIYGRGITRQFSLGKHCHKTFADGYRNWIPFWDKTAWHCIVSCCNKFPSRFGIQPYRKLGCCKLSSGERKTALSLSCKVRACDKKRSYDKVGPCIHQSDIHHQPWRGPQTRREREQSLKKKNIRIHYFILISIGLSQIK